MIIVPFREDKDLGKAYNEAISKVDSEWITVIDYDVMFPSGEAVNLISRAQREYPDTGIFTCWATRIHPLAEDQLAYFRDRKIVKLSIDDFLLENKVLLSCAFSISEINHPISGFLMSFKKSTWEKYPFPETGRALGVDNAWSEMILRAGLKIRRINNLLVWHTYRWNDHTDKSHLR